MPWAIFDKDFNWKIPGTGSTQWVRPSPEPQEYKTQLIADAVAKGVARLVKAPTAGERRASKGKAKS